MPIFEYNCRKCKHPFETIVTLRGKKSPARNAKAPPSTSSSLFSARRLRHRKLPHPAVAAPARRRLAAAA